LNANEINLELHNSMGANFDNHVWFIRRKVIINSLKVIKNLVYLWMDVKSFFDKKIALTCKILNRLIVKMAFVDVRWKNILTGWPRKSGLNSALSISSPVILSHTVNGSFYHIWDKVLKQNVQKTSLPKFCATFSRSKVAIFKRSLFKRIVC